MSRMRERTRKLWTRVRRSRWSKGALVALLGLIVAGFVLDRALDEPLRRIVERRINESLVGYSARVGRLDFHLLGLSLDLENSVVRQNVHPEPPVLDVPRLAMSVRWRDLLYLRLVADARFDDPTVHANLAQLQEENRDPVTFREHGWQQALEAIYPLKINELRIVNGKLTYQDSGFKPLSATGVELLARNIRNIRSADHQYPSEVHARATVFDVGRVVIDGHADFLAEPRPGLAGRIELEQLQLDYFEPVTERFGVHVHEGFLSGAGTFETGPNVEALDLESLVVTDASVDYFHGGAQTEEAKRVAQKISETARSAVADPEVSFRIHQLLMKNGTLGIVNAEENPPYRVFFDHADFELRNLSSHPEDGPAEASLRGAFMGSGKVRGSGTFYPEGKGANFQAKLEIENTQLTTMNDLLRARGKFDVAQGTFSLYTQVRVRDGRIEGYVKPLFRDLKVYDSEQDKHENAFRKMWEAIVGGVAKILENRRGEVATVASLEGPVENPGSNALEVIGGLLRNAFVRAIRPGFQNELARVNPLRYHELKKQQKKEQKEGPS